MTAYAAALDEAASAHVPGVSDEIAAGTDMRALSRSEMRSRSLAGVFFLTTSSVANLLIGFFASLVLARLLTPNDFGIVAVGSTAALLGGALADGGLGAGMVRRPEPPSPAELRTMNGIQLTLALVLCVPAMIVALDFGRTGEVTAVMIASLPITTLQTPGRIILSRQMRYNRQVSADFIAQAGSQIFSIVAVIFGAGVWGLASATVVRAVVATILIATFSIGFERPSLEGWRNFGGLLRFGLSFQASWYTLFAREQGLNIVVAAMAGLTSLGIWTFTNKIFQLPLLAFSSLYVVGFPAMANLLARGEDPAPVITRTVRRAAIAGTFVFPVFVAAAPKLIPALFGDQWSKASGIVPFICLSTFILGSIAVAATSYLSAANRPGTVALASVALGVVWIGGTALLLPKIGVDAIGVANLAGSLVEASLLSAAVRRTAGVDPSRPLLRPLCVAVFAGALGWILCTRGPSELWIAIASGAVTFAVAALGLFLLCRKDLLETIRLVTTILRSMIPRLRRPSVQGV